MAGKRGADGGTQALIRADVRHRGENVADGRVECDPAERIHNDDAFGPEGSLAVRIVLPVSTAGRLQEALELLDEVADLFRPSETIPAGNSSWDALQRAIGKVLVDMELAGLIEPA